MHIVKWLLRRPEVLVAILAIIAILLLTFAPKSSHHKEDKHKMAATEQHNSAPVNEVNQATNATTATQMPVAGTPHAVVAEAVTTEVVETPLVVAETVDQGTAQPLVAVQEVVTESTDTAGTSLGGDAVATQGQATDTATANTADTSAQAGATGDNSTEVTAESSVEDLLRAARESYWSAEYDRSIDFYQALLKKDNQATYIGELANVYWKKGDSNAALDLYISIAPWLAAEGRTSELSSLKAYADTVDPHRAAVIGNYLK